jgi:ABC-2 type transport system permease protein
MTLTLVLKLLRDLRWSLLAVALLLGGFQFLWAKVTERILGRLNPFFAGLANLGGFEREDIEKVVFEGPAKITRTIIGGEAVSLDRAMDLLSIGYVHPLMQVIFCVWAVGRAAGAIAGEIDRGTMELLLAQPVPRSRLILAHFLVDVITIPVLCGSLWLGTTLGAWAVTPIKVEQPKFDEIRSKRPALPFGLDLSDLLGSKGPTEEERKAQMEKDLQIRPLAFARAMPLVAGLIFAVTGCTMWLSSLGRYRIRVLGIAVLIVLIQFLINVLAQMWDDVAWLRPLTVFYYYQPQQVILSGDWCVHFHEWGAGGWLKIPMPLVLFGVGAVGYLLALRTLARRDLPAPL